MNEKNDRHRNKKCDDKPAKNDHSNPFKILTSGASAL